MFGTGKEYALSLFNKALARPLGYYYFNWSDCSCSVSEHKICIVGLDNAGKTTILYQFLMNEVVQVPTSLNFSPF